MSEPDTDNLGEYNILLRYEAGELSAAKAARAMISPQRQPHLRGAVRLRGRRGGLNAREAPAVARRQSHAAQVRHR
jgi:hypothetical protein